MKDINKLIIDYKTKVNELADIKSKICDVTKCNDCIFYNGSDAIDSCVIIDLLTEYCDGEVK